MRTHTLPANRIASLALAAAAGIMACAALLLLLARPALAAPAGAAAQVSWRHAVQWHPASLHRWR